MWTKSGWIKSRNQDDNVIVVFSQSSIWAALRVTLQQEHPANQSPDGEGGTLQQRH